jgi:hypothetical protein
LTVSEHVPTISELRDAESAAEVGPSVAAAGGMRQRRKIERNTSAPLPGMLQVMTVIIHKYHFGCEMSSATFIALGFSLSFV